ncbi:RHS repeat-associated core domain-containing protein, partial [Candidatus Parcubacteria bacterium]
MLSEGQVRYRNGSLPTRYTYTGQYTYLDDFGLYFYNARWYDPQLGRFTQPDSLIPDPAEPLSWERYAYVRNNPLKFSDPSGHCPWCITIGLGALIGAGVTYGVQVAANV